MAAAKAMNEVIIPMIDVKPGFISNMWLGNDETGAFAGIYQFANKGDAEAHVQ